MNLRNSIRERKERAREGKAKSAIILAGQEGLLNTKNAHAVLGRMPHEEDLLRATQVHQAREHASSTRYTGRTLLMNAARIGDLQRTLELLKNDAHVEVIDNNGCNALHWACIGVNGRYSAEHPAVLEALLHPPGRSANLKSVRRNRPAGSALIDGVTIINKNDDDDMSPLAHACFYGNPELVQILLDNGANINQPSGHLAGNTPLIVASNGGQADVIRVLLRHGANLEDKLNILEHTPLIAACNNDHDKEEAVNVLLEAGANTMAVSISDYTCIHLAAFKNNINIIRLLVSKGMDVNIQTSIFGHTPLQMVCMLGSPSNNKVETARVLLELGADINKQDVNGNTPLHQACRDRADPGLIEFLIANGANVGISNSQGQTPYDIVTEVQRYWDAWIIDVRQIFRMAGVDIEYNQGLNGPLLFTQAGMIRDDEEEETNGPREGGGRRRTKRTRKMRRRR